jgi:hypothetical protein
MNEDERVKWDEDEESRKAKAKHRIVSWVMAAVGVTIFLAAVLSRCY